MRNKVFEIFAILLILCAGYTVLASESIVRGELKSRNYQQVEVGSMKLFSLDWCGKSIRYSFQASKNGQDVSGHVCIGPFGLLNQVYTK